MKRVLASEEVERWRLWGQVVGLDLLEKARHRDIALWATKKIVQPVFRRVSKKNKIEEHGITRWKKSLSPFPVRKSLHGSRVGGCAAKRVGREFCPLSLSNLSEKEGRIC